MDDRVRNKKKHFEKICRKVGKAINQFNLVEEGDRVMIGISGGKDSMILLEAIANRKKHLPFDFHLFAIHVTARNIDYRMDTDYLQGLCQQINVPLFLEEIEVDLNAKPSKTPCFICSWNRRKAIFEKSKDLNCNKIALGHHKDDAIETMLLNLVYHGSISSLPQKLEMFDGRIELIRPLLMIPEQELNSYARLRKYRKHEKSCPYDDSTKREAIKQLIREFEKLNTSSRKNIFRAMDNIYPDYLPRSKC